MLDRSSRPKLRAAGISNNSGASFKLREENPSLSFMENSHKDELSLRMKICTPYMVSETHSALHPLPTLRYTIP